MNILSELKERFRVPLAELVPDPAHLLDMIRPSQDARFGDYQANCAMPLGKQLKKPPREIAQQLVDQVDVSDLCHPPEVAGPGFINLKLKDEWMTERLFEALHDDRLAIGPTETPRTYVIDFSSPNVAKPMHVGHIRSTVIGDALARVLRFLGHRVITDNHLGDWGTQFGMIIYGYKHFLDSEAYQVNPVAELSRLYRLVRKLMDYQSSLVQLPKMQQERTQLQTQLAQAESTSTDDKAAKKKAAKQKARLGEKTKDLDDEIKKAQKLNQVVESDASFLEIARQHADVNQVVLDETAKLHADDPENLELWKTVLPHCRDEIQRIYQRLDIRFDYEYGESFYHDQLADVVASFEEKSLAQQSEGATCVFLPDYDAPMIIRKKDGAFLYATSDLATIDYRMKTWKPDAILYVVDHRQHEHFGKLFAAARLWGWNEVELSHVSFGTVMGDDRKPFKTREGDTIGLEGLIDEAVRRALLVVCENDDKKPDGPELSPSQRKEVAEIVGVGALKYADLSQNRASDYVFEYDKMVALRGDTAPYSQYSFARVHGIYRKGDIDIDAVKAAAKSIQLATSHERALALQLLRFEEALLEVLVDYRPNLLTTYLFELSRAYATFFENCPVLKAETSEQKESRLLLCHLTARTLKLGLELLGIKVAQQM